jgi:hypothetical protein
MENKIINKEIFKNSKEDSKEDKDNSEDYDSVFIKLSELPKSKPKLSIQEIINNIPKPNFDKPDLAKRKKHIEWRWRIYNINKKNLVEISFFDPKNKKRLFVNDKGEYVEREIPCEFNTMVAKEYYYYAE